MGNQTIGKSLSSTTSSDGVTIKDTLTKNGRVVGSKMLLNLWDRYDIDGNGLLDRGECLQFLSDFGASIGVEISPATAHAYFDKTSKRYLTREDFLTLFSKIDELVFETPKPRNRSPSPPADPAPASFASPSLSSQPQPDIAMISSQPIPLSPQPAAATTHSSIDTDLEPRVHLSSSMKMRRRYLPSPSSHPSSSSSSSSLLAHSDASSSTASPLSQAPSPRATSPPLSASLSSSAVSDADFSPLMSDTDDPWLLLDRTQSPDPLLRSSASPAPLSPSSSSSDLLSPTRSRKLAFGLAVIHVDTLVFPFPALSSNDRRKYCFLQLSLPDGTSVRSVSLPEHELIDWRESFTFLLHPKRTQSLRKSVDAGYILTVLLMEEPKFSKLRSPVTLGACAIDISGLFKNAHECQEIKISEELVPSPPAHVPSVAGNIKLRAVYKSLTLPGDTDLLERDEYGFPVSSDTLASPSYLEWHRHYTTASLQSHNSAWIDYARSKWMSQSNEKMLAYGGIPTAHRIFLWQKMARVDTRRLKYPPSYYRQLLEDEDDFSAPVRLQIWKDLGRTFPNHPLYADRAPAGRAALSRVLYALARHYPVVGYCQSMNFICGFLLLFGDEEDVFWLMSAIVESILPNYFSTDMLAIRVDQLVLGSLVASSNPTLFNHLRALGFELDIVSTQWFLALYIGYLPTETVLRMFDSLFYRGSFVLFILALGVLQLNTPALLRMKEMDEVFVHLKGQIQLGYDVEKIMQEGKRALRPYMNQINPLRSRYTQQFTDAAKHNDFARLARETAFSESELEVLYHHFSNIVIREIPPEIVEAHRLRQRSRSSHRLGSPALPTSPTISSAAEENFQPKRPLSTAARSSLLDSDSIAMGFESIAESPPKIPEDSPLFLIDRAPKLHRGLDEDRFRALLSTMLKLPYDVIDRLYFLYAKEGLCTFAQFTRMMFIICRGTPDQKLELWFQILDTGSKSYLTVDDVAALIVLLNELLPNDRLVSIDVIHTVILLEDGKFFLDQFLLLLEHDALSLAKTLMFKLVTLDLQFFKNSTTSLSPSTSIHEMDDLWDWTKP